MTAPTGSLWFDNICIAILAAQRAIVKIQAAIARTPEDPYTIESCDLSEPGADEVLVEVHACGICHTDMSVKAGKLPVEFPAVLGHEGAGVVLKTGSNVGHVKVGDHVSMSFGHCGSCSWCHSGEPAYCEEFAFRNFVGLDPRSTPTHHQDDQPIHGRFFSQSSFATHAISKGTNTVKIDSDMPFHLAAPLGCGIQTGAGAILNVLKPEAKHSIAVFGTGAVGLSAVMAAKIANCREIVAIDLNPARLKKAESLGASLTIDASKEDPLEIISTKFPNLLDFIFETSGSSKVSETAFNCLGRRGMGAYVSAPPLGTGFNVDINYLVAFGRTLRGVIEGDSKPSEFIPELINYYKRGLLPLEEIVTTYEFSDINEAVAAAKSGDVVKPVLLMQ